MTVIFEQVLMLFIFIIIGYILSVSGIVNSEHSAIISKLLVYVFLPANIVKTFIRNCTVTYITQNYSLIIFSSVIIIIFAVAARFAARLFTKKRDEYGIYEYSLIIPNFGYMGYAFVGAVFGEAGLMDAMMFSMPISVYTYTVGYCILSGKPFSFKSLLNPTMISLSLGMILGLVGVGDVMPSIAYSVLDTASACMAPVSMLLVGIVLADFKISEMLRDARSYLIVALRLFVIPVSVGAILSILAPDYVTRTAVILYAMPCGLNTVVFVKNAGGNCKIGAGLALISSVLACASIPLVMMLFGISV